MLKQCYSKNRFIFTIGQSFIQVFVAELSTFSTNDSEVHGSNPVGDSDQNYKKKKNLQRHLTSDLGKLNESSKTKKTFFFKHLLCATFSVHLVHT